MKSAMLDWEKSRDHEITVGLAAVQINKLLRVFIIRNKADSDSYVVFVNPVITKHKGSIKKDYEGCLSVKDIYGLVPRYDAIRIRAMGLDSKQFTMKAQGDIARILQHETDHTNGIVFIDHIKDDSDAFYQLSADGNLQQLDYEKDVKHNRILW